MTYRVTYTDSFLRDIADHVDYLRSERVSDHIIRQWYDRLFKQIDTLDVWPRMYPIDEAYTAQVGRTTHKINFRQYLVIYQVDDDHRRVELVAFLHGATRDKA